MINTCLSLTISGSYSLTFPLIIFYSLRLHNSIPKSSATISVHPQALGLYIPWNFVWIRHVDQLFSVLQLACQSFVYYFSGWVELVNQNTFVTMTHSPSIYYALSQSTYYLWFAKMLVSSIHSWSINLHRAYGVESYIFICSCHIVLQEAPGSIWVGLAWRWWWSISFPSDSLYLLIIYLHYPITTYSFNLHLFPLPFLFFPAPFSHAMLAQYAM